MRNLSKKRKAELIKFCDWYLENVISISYYICNNYTKYFGKSMPLYLYGFMFKHSSIFKYNINDIKHMKKTGICLFVGFTERREFIEILRKELS